MDADTLRRYADLIVTVGANVQPGQIVAIGCEPGKEQLTRAVADSAYRHGAKFVDVGWFDPWIKRARVEHAADETLDFVPEWLGQRLLALSEARAARVGLSGPVAPGLMADLDPRRVGRDHLPMLKEAGQVVDARTTNWTISPCPTQEWADLAFGGDLAELERQIIHVCRLDEPDPSAAWRERRDVLAAVARRLTERRFDALHYAGPGTDLTIGLLPSSTWMTAAFETAAGLEHMPNVPSEEVFTSPDPLRADGHVASTRPLVLRDGTIVRDLRVRFEGGRAVQIDASEGAEALRTVCEADEGAPRLGEVALVDGDGRIGKLETVFFDTLLDENAASHVALGHAYGFAIADEADRERANSSQIHIDFMIGADELLISGVTADGERVPVLHQGRWLI